MYGGERDSGYEFLKAFSQLNLSSPFYCMPFQSGHHSHVRAIYYSLVHEVKRISFFGVGGEVGQNQLLSRLKFCG
jgi:hypothetical protein